MLTAIIHALSHDGRGITNIGGKVVFITDALPGETIAFEYTRKSKSFDEGKTIEIIQASPDRVSPLCPHYGICGGCNLQHLSPEKQVLHKQQVLLDQLKHFGRGITPEIISPPLLSKAFGYRCKARLGVKFVAKKAKVLVGFRERSHRFLADLQTCPVLRPKIGMQLANLSQLIHALSIYDQIAQIEVAVGDDQAAMIFRHLKALSEKDLEQLSEFGQTHAIDIYLQPGGINTIHKLYPSGSPAQLFYTLPEYSLTYFFNPSDFTQINPEINHQMIHQAIAWLSPQSSDEILDLFCGLGNFTLPLAKHAKFATGIEGDAELIRRAQANAEYNKIINIEFKKVDLASNNNIFLSLKNNFNKLLLDPPRSGALEIVNYNQIKNFERILYISCNPATLARDADILVNQHGFTLKKAGILDMFPHTAHVESMALFTR